MNRYIKFLMLLAIFSLLFTTIPVEAKGATFIGQHVSSLFSARFAVIGDYGLAGAAELDVASQVKSWNPDFIVSLGDNNYDSGLANTIDFNIGQYYHDYIYPYTGIFGSGSTTNKFFPTLGNHDWVAANAQPYLDYFSLPGNERYYDFVQGPVHFFVLDSDQHEPDGNSQTSIQAIWLKDALSESSSPWNIVLLHLAPFSSGPHGSNSALQWPYEAWGADAVLAGHDHTYERIIKGKIPFFVNGLGGHSIYNFGSPVAGSQLRYNSDYGAMLVDATPTNINFQFITRTGVVVDQYSLKYDIPPIIPSNISFQEITSGLNKPVFITNAGDGSGRLFIIEQQGHIRIIRNGALLAATFLDIQSIIKSSGGEQGLMALAFDPSYASTGNFYVAYTAPRGGDATGSDLVLEKFSVSDSNPDLADPDSGVILLTISHPINSNHNGGTLAFGGDGYLYWSTGDGGSGGDPANNAQQKNNLLGKILRIDVNSGSPYGIPASNPFFFSIDPNIKKEIWAYGLRNPWRMSFDKLTLDLYIGDVGQAVREEVNFQSAGSTGGENYGWRLMEGSLCYNPSSGCDQNGKVLPVAEYDHTLGNCSITGGHVYRGSNFPSLGGYYFYGDFCSGRLFSLYSDSTLGWTSVRLLDTPYTLSTFGEDEQGELYLADFGTGKIYNIRYHDTPIVSSSALANSNPTAAINVNFTVTFTESVTGVDASDFSLTTSGVSGATVKEVSGTGSTYTVTVNTGLGNGTIRLNVVDDNSIVDAALNPLGGVTVADGNFTTSQAYTINKDGIITDTWAVQVSPSANVSQLATQLGAQNLGQIGSLIGYYLFRITGSATQSGTIAALFTANPQVLWFEQQVARGQSKRENIDPVSVPPSPNQENLADVTTVTTATVTIDGMSFQDNSNEVLSIATSPVTSSPEPVQISATITESIPTTTEPFRPAPVSTQTTITQIPPSSIPTRPVQPAKMATLPNEPSLSPTAMIRSSIPFTESENNSSNGGSLVAVMITLSLAAGGIFLSMGWKK